VAGSSKARNVITISFVLWLCASAFFFWVWYERYLRFDFNELGRYYDAEAEVVYTDAGFVWALPAFGFLIVALLRLLVAVLRRRNDAPSNG
jgi:hypothetical protein